MGKSLYIILASVVLLVVLAGGAYLLTKKDNNTNSSETSNSNTVSIKSMAFSSSTVKVKVGTTVTWTNNDSVAHTVTSNTGVFSSATLSKGDTFKFTFNSAGEFSYFCSLHPQMTGKVVVE